MLNASLRPDRRNPTARSATPGRRVLDLDRAEVTALIGSLGSDRDRAIAGLMPFSGLRSAEVLSVAVRDVDGNTGDAAAIS